MIRAFINGWREWASDLTMHYDSPRKMWAYDLGRTLATMNAEQKEN